MPTNSLQVSIINTRRQHRGVILAKRRHNTLGNFAISTHVETYNDKLRAQLACDELCVTSVKCVQTRESSVTHRPSLSEHRTFSPHRMRCIKHRRPPVRCLIHNHIDLKMIGIHRRPSLQAQDGAGAPRSHRMRPYRHAQCTD